VNSFAVTPDRLRATWRECVLVGALTSSATASHLLRVIAASPTGDTQDLSLVLIVLLYAGTLGLGTVTALLLHSTRAVRIAIGILTFLNLSLLTIAHGIGGARFGGLLLELRVLWPVAILTLLLTYLPFRHYSRNLCSLGSRTLEPLAVLLVASTLALDLRDALLVVASRRPQEVLARREVDRIDPHKVDPEAKSVIHVILDELSGSLMVENPELAATSFHTTTTAGAYYPNAYTNSIWTLDAIPQALTGDRKPRASPLPGVLDAYYAAGYSIHLYLGGGVLQCSRSSRVECFSVRWAWREAIFENDPLGYLRHGAARLRSIYTQRFLGAYWLPSEEPVQRPIERAHTVGTSPSLVLFERALRDIEQAADPGYFLIHLLLPHPPYVHDRNCQITGDPRHASLNVASVHAPGYVEQTHCAHELVRRLISRLRALGRFDSTHLVVHGDHGPRHELVSWLETRPESPLPSPLTAAEAVIAETSARIFLWVKPAGDREAAVIPEPIQLLELAPWLLQQLEPGTGEAHSAPQPHQLIEPGARLLVQGLDQIESVQDSTSLLREMETGRWSIATSRDEGDTAPRPAAEPRRPIRGL